MIQTNTFSTAQVETIQRLLEDEFQAMTRLEELAQSLVTSHDAPNQKTPNDPDTSRQLLEQLNADYQELQAVREQTVTRLGEITGEPVQLTRLIAQVDPARADSLRRLRGSLLDKMIRIRSIIFAGQMSLAYRVDHYRQLLAAISGQSATPNIYGADGRAENPASNTTIVQDC